MPVTPIVLLILSAFVLPAEPAVAQSYCPAKNPPSADINPGASANLRGPVHPNALNTLSCVVDGLKKIGLSVKTLWGYGCRPLATSNHPRGLAVDVNQSARDKTFPTVPRAQGVEIAKSCNATSGAVWHNPDNGHFEVRSLSRSQQQQRRPASAPQYPRYRTFWEVILSWFGLK